MNDKPQSFTEALRAFMDALLEYARTTKESK